MMEATNELRWLDREIEYTHSVDPGIILIGELGKEIKNGTKSKMIEKVLQQLWVAESGIVEWRDVSVVGEDN